MPEPVSDMNRNQEVGFFTDFSSYGQEEPLALEINMRNLENLTLLDNLNAVNGIPGIENNENIAFFQDYDGPCNNHFLPDSDDTKEPNVSRTVRVPSSEHVAEIVGRQGCKIKDLRARTNTYIKTPMRTEPPVFVVTGKETAVNLVISEINSAAEHFTQIRASRNHHKNSGLGNGSGGEMAKPVTRDGDVVLHVTVPYRVVGLVVGLKGQTIKQIQQDTDTFIVTPNRDKAPIFEIRGQPSNVERARIMIERHIEVRTRNCRLQDTTNLQNGDETRYGSNDYHYNYTDSPSPPNGNSNHLSNNYSSNNSNNYNSLHSPNYNLCSPHSSSTGNYSSWRSYSGLMEPATSSQTAPIQTWSNATSDYNGVIGNGHSTSTSMRSMGGSMPYSNAMSVGSMSSHSNGSINASPPQDFMGSGSFSSRQAQCPTSGPGNNRLGGADPSCEGNSSFSSFPLLTTSASTPTKGSLVLGNLIQQSGPNTSSVLGSREMTSGMNGFGGSRSGHESMGYSTPTHRELFRGGFAGDHHMLGQTCTSEGNGFPSGESSPASKSCSLSESSGSQGSPTPRMCKVCEEADVVAALVPCGHNHFCMECADSIVNKSSEMDRKCPICSAAVADVLRILA